ncbi:MAG: double-strand break repair helicase AddA [Rhizobiaceae bacterium]
MSTIKTITPDLNTIEQQRSASNPKNSAWVSANAGAGKTYVLTRRVVRLLLQGTDPSRILCLTYTKAGAGEMANRVFELLGQWATLPDNKLIKELEAVEGIIPNKQQCAVARTLFARALETPGGLKIQTIHGFCEALLHQFPLEANIPGNFSVMADAEQKQLMADAQRSVILEADEDPESPIAQAFASMMAVATDTAIENIFAAIISNRDELSNWLIKVGGPKGAELATKKRFQFSPNDTVESLQSKALETIGFDSLDLPQLARVCAEAGQGGTNIIAAQIQIYVEASDPLEKLDAIAATVLKADGKLRKYSGYPSKPVHEAMPGIRERVEEVAHRLIEARLRIKTFKLIEYTTSMLTIAEAVIERFRQTKRQRGLLDFDDLVARTADLLTRKTARRWVLYKLDLGIDHILVDEAQDTSPNQWQIISSLVEEFFSGDGSRSALRTIFAVGDEKQSIFSFQGAEPESFDQQRRGFKKKAKDVDQEFKDIPLSVSFRSTQDVLSAVDKVFSLPQNADGLTSQSTIPAHVAIRKGEAGSVEVWPLIKPQAADEAPDWHTPQTQGDSTHQALGLAQKIADQIKSWIGKEVLEASGALIGAGDILILVSARDRFVSDLNRALKDRGIAVAGADRLSLTKHIAVQDLIALGQIMLTPEDDLSLAAVLKSPLIGLDEEQLFELARSRLHENYEQSLFEALAQNQTEPFIEAHTKLSQWQNRADVVPAYEFYAQLLGADGGRKNFYARLGAEAEDVLDAFLDLTLSHEQSGLPGLQAFLVSLAKEAPEIKREMDQASGQVRIMTVHAAKGLEAPIVFLIDKGSAPYQASRASPLYHWQDAEDQEGYIWLPRAGDHGDVTLGLEEAEIQKSEQEYRRLLYVAMTRAEDRLIICGYRGGTSTKKLLWHEMVSTALEDEWRDIVNGDGDLIYHQWHEPNNRKSISNPKTTVAAKPQNARALEEIPPWINHHLPKESTLPRPLSPSGAQALIDESLAEIHTIPSLLEAATPKKAESVIEQKHSPRLRGTVIHRLLQVLPDMTTDQRWFMAEDYLTHSLPEFSIAERAKILAAVRETLTSSKLSPYLDPATSRAEVPIMGRLDFAHGPRPISGSIDRLAVLDDKIMLLDYKTSPHVPGTIAAVPKDYITQMALYRALVTKLYPDRPVEAALVWTHSMEGPLVMVLPQAALDQAYAIIAQL